VRRTEVARPFDALENGDFALHGDAFQGDAFEGDVGRGNETRIELFVQGAAQLDPLALRRLLAA